ncbi:MAG: hypothetical protein ACREUU_04340, partial [Gammaproteobacteria bacterium]
MAMVVVATVTAIVPDSTTAADSLASPGMVTLCHKLVTPGEHTLTVASSAVPVHMAHGDKAGACEAPPPPTSSITPCARVYPPLAITTREADDAEGERLGKARKDAREAAYPDRPLSPFSRTNIPKVGAGWRYHWPELTGNRMQFVFFLSRDNALLSATAFAPDPVRCPGRRPLVVIGTGFGVDAEIRKWWAAQALAEAGYVALTFDYLGQGFSEETGHSNPDGTGTPIPPACGDANCTRGADDRFGGLLDAQDAISFAASTPDKPYRGGFEGQDGNTVFPFHGQVHPNWIGFAGHSRGAKVASVLQGMDERLDAVVA